MKSFGEPDEYVFIYLKEKNEKEAMITACSLVDKSHPQSASTMKVVEVTGRTALKHGLANDD